VPSIMGRLVKMLPRVLLSQEGAICRLCDLIGDRCRNDNNGDMTTNGELHLMQRMLPHARRVRCRGEPHGVRARVWPGDPLAHGRQRTHEFHP